MKNKLINTGISTLLFILSINYLQAQNKLNYENYRNPGEIISALQTLNKSSRQQTFLHKIATTPGKNNITIIEIGSQVNKSTINPAVFIIANIDGNIPLASEAAIYLSDLILQNPENHKHLTWYILPCANPDAATAFFSKPLIDSNKNNKTVNNDMDEQTDEDNFDDLNHDGYITQMRVKHPEGEWIVSKTDPRILRKADHLRNEKGMYKIFSEGIDNDNDGLFNEDTKGGVNINNNFPCLFNYNNQSNGIWSGSETETYAIMKFITEHPEIGLSVVFGNTNCCFEPPVNKKKNSKFPEYPDEDLEYYKKISEEYKDYMKENNISERRLLPQKIQNGSFELWSYFYLGIPTFSMDFWAIPKPSSEKKNDKNIITPDSLSRITAKEFKEFPDSLLEKIIKENNVENIFPLSGIKTQIIGNELTPEQLANKIKEVIEKRENETIDTEMLTILEYSDNQLGGKGFVNWETCKHPTLGEVEVGGIIPYTKNTPPPDQIDSLLAAQVPFVLKLTEKLPELKIAESKVTNKGKNIFAIEVWIENIGYLPFPTAIGVKNRQPAPAVIHIEKGNYTLVCENQRVPINAVSGKGVIKKEWLIYAPGIKSITLFLESKTAGNDKATVQLKNK